MSRSSLIIMVPRRTEEAPFLYTQIDQGDKNPSHMAGVNGGLISNRSGPYFIQHKMTALQGLCGLGLILIIGCMHKGQNMVYTGNE